MIDPPKKPKKTGGAPTAAQQLMGMLPPELSRVLGKGVGYNVHSLVSGLGPGGTGPSAGSIMAFQQMAKAGASIGESYTSAGHSIDQFMDLVSGSARIMDGNVNTYENLGGAISYVGDAAEKSARQLERANLKTKDILKQYEQLQKQKASGGSGGSGGGGGSSGGGGGDDDGPKSRFGGMFEHGMPGHIAKTFVDHHLGAPFWAADAPKLGLMVTMLNVIGNLQRGTQDLSRSTAGFKLEDFAKTASAVQGATHMSAAAVFELGKAFQTAGIPINGTSKDLKGYMTEAGDMMELTGMSAEQASMFIRAMIEEGKTASELHKTFNELYSSMQKNNLSLAEFNASLKTADELWRGLNNVNGGSVSVQAGHIIAATGFAKSMNMETGEAGSALKGLANPEVRWALAGVLGQNPEFGGRGTITKEMDENPAVVLRKALSDITQRIDRMGPTQNTAQLQQRILSLLPMYKGFITEQSATEFRTSIEMFKASNKDFKGSIDQAAIAIKNRFDDPNKPKTYDSALDSYHAQVGKMSEFIGQSIQSVSLIIGNGILPTLVPLFQGLALALHKLVEIINMPVIGGFVQLIGFVGVLLAGFETLKIAVMAASAVMGAMGALGAGESLAGAGLSAMGAAGMAGATVSLGTPVGWAVMAAVAAAVLIPLAWSWISEKGNQEAFSKGWKEHIEQPWQKNIGIMTNIMVELWREFSDWLHLSKVKEVASNVAGGVHDTVSGMGDVWNAASGLARRTLGIPEPLTAGTSSARIAEAAAEAAGSKLWTADAVATQNGLKGCAAAVSSVLSRAGFMMHQLGVSGLGSSLLEKGWKVVPLDKMQPGDVVNTSHHTGIVGEGGVWNNHSSSGMWTKDSFSDFNKAGGGGAVVYHAPESGSVKAIPLLGPLRDTTQADRNLLNKHHHPGGLVPPPPDAPSLDDNVSMGTPNAEHLLAQLVSLQQQLIHHVAEGQKMARRAATGRSSVGLDSHGSLA